jgi:cell division protein FtsB
MLAAEPHAIRETLGRTLALSMPRITISYRRDDSAAITGRIFDRLAWHYGRESIFRDIDNIPPGVDFRKHIEGILDDSDVVLAIVGPRWVGPRGGQSRLTNAADPVRVEIETALRKNCPLIPVLVLRGSMPRVEQLPETLQDFAYHNAVSVDTGQDFDVHMARLMRAMDRILEGMSMRGASVTTAVRASDLDPALRPDSGALRRSGDSEIEELREANDALEARVAELTAARHEEAPSGEGSRDQNSAATGRLKQQVKDLTEQLAAERKAALALQGRQEKELARAQTKIEQLNERIAELGRELHAVRAAGPSAARRHPAMVAALTTIVLMAAGATMIVVNITEWHRSVQWAERIVLEARAWLR